MDIFDVKLNENNTLEKGWLLISEPFLPDPNFERTVVLICEHEEKGSFGLIINKPTQIHLDEVSEIKRSPHSLYVGGPVDQNSLHFIHIFPDIEGSIPLKDGVFWGGNYEQIRLMTEEGILNNTNSRFFMGYSGWGENQLEEELERNSWIISNFDLSKLFKTKDEELWQLILREMGGKYRMVSNFPIDPRLN